IDVATMLLALPLDIVTEVLGFLSYADLARVKTACRSLRDAIDNTASLSYTLALGINAMKEGSRTGLGSTQRLQKLRKYQENWRRLQFSARTDLPSTEDCYFEVSGAFAAFTIDDAKQKISFTQLPSELRGLEKRQWTIELTDPVRDFTIEPAMDLLVQLEAPFFVVIWNWETGEEYVVRKSAPGTAINLVWDMPTSHNPKRATELSPAWFTPAPRDRIIGIEINAFDENLPDDADYWPYLLIITLRILLFLDYAEIARCEAVCRALRAAIDGTAVLQYKIKLGKLYMVNAGDLFGGIAVADRVQRLDEYAEAWRSLEWSTETHVPFEGNLWEIAGGVIACTSLLNQDINFVQLPSRLRQIEQKTWTLNMPQRLRDFTIDPSQDLLVNVVNPRPHEFEVHLLSMSTGQKHDFAQTSPLICRLGRSPVQFEILVFEDRLGILFISNDEVSIFGIWNWHTGHAYEHPFAHDFITSACFLDANTVMATAYAHQVTSPNNVFLKVVDITTPEAPVPLYHLQLPDLHPNADGMTGIIWDSPPTWKDDVPAQGCFAPSPAQRLIGIAMSAWVVTGNLAIGADARRVPLMFIVSVPALRGSFPPRGPSSAYALSVLWEEWGPHSARLFDHECSPVWVCYIRGLRYAVLDDHEDDEPARTYSIYDFSGNGPATTEAGEQLSAVYTHTDVFIEPVVSSLPCHHYRGQVPRRDDLPDLSSVMLTDDGVVFVPHPGGEFWAYTS
ncbi:hypothetical protein HDZ31DRAFT_48695, partial [Schizophyllum fasciatum]